MKYRTFVRFVTLLSTMLLLFLVAPTPQIAIASAETGDTPFDPIGLDTTGANGNLGPGESRWYSFSQTADDGALDVDASITMFFTPRADQIVGRVNFQVFPASELNMWNEMGGKGGDSTKMVNLGDGGMLDRDSNPATVDLVWSGRISSGVTYVVEVYNSATEPIDYWIFPEDIRAVDLGPKAAAAPTRATTKTGENPFDALTLGASGVTGVLPPGESVWYAVTPTSIDGSPEVEAYLTMFFTPLNDQNADRVNFQVFPADQLSNWNEMGAKGGDSTKMINLGVGGLSGRDSNPATGDLIWTGRLGSGTTYTVQVYNSCKEQISYWLFPEDVMAAELGPKMETATEAPGPETGENPFDALTLQDYGITGALAPGESMWYAFTPTSVNGSPELDASVTMFFTPRTDQNVGRVNFQMFTADQLSNWSDTGVMGGDSTKMVNLGVGGMVDRDGNPDTVDLVWRGQVGSGVTYYIQVYNSAKESISYWLFPKDVEAADLGSPTEESPASSTAVAAETGDTPFEALALEQDGAAGSLAPGESAWYAFTPVSVDGSPEVNASVTMFYTPRTDQNVGRVNFQAFPAGELSMWNEMGGRGGDSTKMTNLGGGGMDDRDSNPTTVDLVWSGPLSSQETYYLQVYNSAKEPIYYWIFPEDVRAINLGQ